eukprot:1297222-Pyramimonas_sp.AAC.1
MSSSPSSWDALRVRRRCAVNKSRSWKSHGTSQYSGPLNTARWASTNCSWVETVKPGSLSLGTATNRRSSIMLRASLMAGYMFENSRARMCFDRSFLNACRTVCRNCDNHAFNAGSTTTFGVGVRVCGTR